MEIQGVECKGLSLQAAGGNWPKRSPQLGPVRCEVSGEG